MLWHCDAYIGHINLANAFNSRLIGKQTSTVVNDDDERTKRWYFSAVFN